MNHGGLSDRYAAMLMRAAWVAKDLRERTRHLHGREFREVVAEQNGGEAAVAVIDRKSLWVRAKSLDLLAVLLDSLMKADNIATGKVPGAYAPLNAEAVIAANPEIIFIAGSSWVNRPGRAHRLRYLAGSDQRFTCTPIWCCRRLTSRLPSLIGGSQPPSTTTREVC